MGQFSFLRFLIAIALIAVGCGMLADIVARYHQPPPMGLFAVVEALCTFPLIGAGFFTLVKRPFLGALIGFLVFVAVLIYLMGNASGV